MTQPVVAFWYEFASTYSFLAAERIERLAAERGVALAWKPFLLGVVFKKQGYDTSPFNLIPDKGRYMWRDMERWCDRLGLPLVRPEPFPQNSLAAARVALALPDDARPAFTKALFRLEFCEGASIADEAVLREAVMQAGEELQPALSAARTDLVKHALRKQTEEAQAKGIFGAPMLETPDGEFFWGNDRIEEALDWVLGSRGAAGR
jgi:2-hydroxychromene-2-carboxylate isomerase